MRLGISIFFFTHGFLESPICRFFFPFGLPESNISEFIATTYRTKLLDQDSRARRKQYIGGLPLAFIGVFGHLSFGIDKSRSRSFETRVSQSRKVSNLQFYTPNMVATGN